MNKKMIATGALVLTVFFFGLMSQTVSAANTQNEQTLIDKIASVFNLNKDKVQEVFQNHRNEMQAQQQKEYETRLNQLVKDGKITESQKKLILDKHAELVKKRQEEMKTMQGKTKEERIAARETKQQEREKKRTEMESWAKTNGIDLQYLMPMGKGMKMMGNK